MTIERIKEALEQAKGGLEWYNKNHPEMKEQIKWQETIIWALEKQVPQKPKAIFSFAPFERRCPNCNTLYCEEDDYYDYCEECGQALDWSDEE